MRRAVAKVIAGTHRVCVGVFLTFLKVRSKSKHVRDELDSVLVLLRCTLQMMHVQLTSSVSTVTANIAITNVLCYSLTFTMIQSINAY